MHGIGQSPNARCAFVFTTREGSTCVVHEDGTTTRTKAARPDPGHEGDHGPKRRSLLTIYVDAASAWGLSAAGMILEPPEARLILGPADACASLLTWNLGKRMWGLAPGSRDIPYATEPEFGLSPVEAWDLRHDVPRSIAHGAQHAGNPITEIRFSDGLVLTAERPSRPGPV